MIAAAPTITSFSIATPSESIFKTSGFGFTLFGCCQHCRVNERLICALFVSSSDGLVKKTAWLINFRHGSVMNTCYRVGHGRQLIT